MSKITLSNVGSLIDATTAAATINANNAIIQTAFDNTLSRDGTSPNTLTNTFDANSNQIINLPAPATGSSPLRLTDASTLNGGGTIATIPAGGSTNAVLTKSSGVSYALAWTNTPTFTTVNTATIPTVVDTLVGRSTTDTLTNKTLATPVISTILNTGLLTLPTSTDTLVGKATTDTLTNKTYDTAGAGNVFKINGTQITSNTGTGSNVLATSPTLVTPVISTATPTAAGVLGFNAGLITYGDGSANRSVVAADTVQGFSNKTFDTATTGNVFKINGTQITANTGTGSNVLATSPALVTPDIGAATGTSVNLTGPGAFYNGTAVPAGGTTGTGIKVSSTSNLGVFFGSGAPTLSAAQGSLYINTTGSSTSTRMYINTNGSTTWTNVTTAA